MGVTEIASGRAGERESLRGEDGKTGEWGSVVARHCGALRSNPKQSPTALLLLSYQLTPASLFPLTIQTYALIFLCVLCGLILYYSLIILRALRG